jgi:hypothetical protein
MRLLMNRSEWVISLFALIVIIGIGNNVLLTIRSDALMKENQKLHQIIDDLTKKVDRMEDRIDMLHTKVTK